VLAAYLTRLKYHPPVSSLTLYLASVLIWGSTWYAITLQLGPVSPAVSVTWRFLLASVLLFAWARARGMRLQFSPREHAWIALQGLLLFCMNYIPTYLAELTLASGLVAVVFSLLAVGNVIGMRVFFGQPVRASALLGGLFGITGVALLFWPDLRAFVGGNASLVGLGLALLGTASASLGNMAAAHNQRSGLPVIPVIAWAMLYGSICDAAWAALTGQAFVIGTTAPYLLSLLYLSVFGSVLAFAAYLTLMSRVGADRAGYALVSVPVVALAISSGLEGLHWTPLMWAGVALVLVGNVLVLRH
jgi:drug/metabolite transporter (DMT)-like permease